MATTTNYGWTTPDDTDLVKDGAAAIRTLGSSVDTTTKNLNPETTLGDMSFRSATSNVNTRLPIGSSGQHLTVVAGVPAWATASDQTPLTTKGDLFTFSTVDARLGVGTNNHRLVAASGEATGLKYVADTQNTVIDAEGDLLVGDAADALQRLAIGSNAQVLTVDTTVDGKIKWATPAGGSTFAGCSLYDTNLKQTIANATNVAITWNSEYFDSDGYHDNSSNTSRITIPAGKGGKYLLTGATHYDANSTGYRALKFKKNGGDFFDMQCGAVSSYTGVSITAIVELVATDYVELITVQTSGGNLDLNKYTATSYGWFAATYLGA